jgi:hypothetical protein
MTGYVDVNEAYYNDLIMESFQPLFGWTLLDPMIMQPLQLPSYSDDATAIRTQWTNLERCFST